MRDFFDRVVLRASGRLATLMPRQSTPFEDDVPSEWGETASAPLLERARPARSAAERVPPLPKHHQPEPATPVRGGTGAAMQRDVDADVDVAPIARQSAVLEATSATTARSISATTSGVKKSALVAAEPVRAPNARPNASTFATREVRESVEEIASTSDAPVESVVDSARVDLEIERGIVETSKERTPAAKDASRPLFARKLERSSGEPGDHVGADPIGNAVVGSETRAPYFRPNVGTTATPNLLADRRTDARGSLSRVAAEPPRIRPDGVEGAFRTESAAALGGSSSSSSVSGLLESPSLPQHQRSEPAATMGETISPPRTFARRSSPAAPNGGSTGSTSESLEVVGSSIDPLPDRDASDSPFEAPPDPTRPQEPSRPVEMRAAAAIRPRASTRASVSAIAPAAQIDQVSSDSLSSDSPSSDSPSSDSPSSEEAPLRVHIGRIEVRSLHERAPAAVRVEPPRARLSLDDYLARKRRV